jgi:hypothetical protein
MEDVDLNKTEIISVEDADLNKTDTGLDLDEDGLIVPTVENGDIGSKPVMSSIGIQQGTPRQSTIQSDTSTTATNL